MPSEAKDGLADTLLQGRTRRTKRSLTMLEDAFGVQHPKQTMPVNPSMHYNDPHHILLESITIPRESAGEMTLIVGASILKEVIVIWLWRGVTKLQRDNLTNHDTGV